MAARVAGQSGQMAAKQVAIGRDRRGRSNVPHCPAVIASVIGTQLLPSNRTMRMVLSSGVPSMVTPGNIRGTEVFGMLVATLMMFSRVRSSPARSKMFFRIQPLM